MCSFQPHLRYRDRRNVAAVRYRLDPPSQPIIGRGGHVRAGTSRASVRRRRYLKPNGCDKKLYSSILPDRDFTYQQPAFSRFFVPHIGFQPVGAGSVRFPICFC